MDLKKQLNEKMDKHIENNNSMKFQSEIKEELKGKDKNWNRSCGEYLGFDDRLNMIGKVNRLQACHFNAVLHFQKQLGTFIGAYEVLSIEEDILRGKASRRIKPDLVSVETPWFMVTNLLHKLFFKYYKNSHYKTKDTENNPFEFLSIGERKKYISPSNNPEYQWNEGWEFEVDPLGHKNLRSFLKARVEVKKKYIKKLVEAREEEKLRVKREETERIELEKQKEKKERHVNKYSKAYENLDEKDGECYVICEKKKVFTNIKNKANCLYVGETENFAARRKNYRDFSNPNNEIVNKLIKKFPKMTREKIINKLTNNVKVKRLRFKSLQHVGYRKHIEGYLIWKLKPLLNTSKTNSIYYKDRSFVVWNEGTGIRTAPGSPATGKGLF
tara:strand:- start:125 stop:1282 length:1158 start_codon:yes stop_codon:yes gene_type:complete